MSYSKEKNKQIKKTEIDQSSPTVSHAYTQSCGRTQVHVQAHNPRGWGNYWWWKWEESVNTCLASFEKTNISLLFFPSTLWGIPTHHLYPSIPPAPPDHVLLRACWPKGDHKSQDMTEIGVEKHTQPFDANVCGKGGGGGAGFILALEEHNPCLDECEIRHRRCHQSPETVARRLQCRHVGASVRLASSGLIRSFYSLSIHLSPWLRDVFHGSVPFARFLLLSHLSGDYV